MGRQRMEKSMSVDRARNSAARRRRALKSVGMALILCVVAAVPAAAKRRKGSGHAKSRHTAEQEMRLKKLDCERNMCSHLEGESKLNCNYKCISEPCYSEIYGHDEVEEGEVDSERSRLFGFCFRRNFRQEMEARKERMRQEAADQRARSHSVDRRGL